MEIKIENDFSNDAIGRREIKVSIRQDDKTPSSADIKKEVCKKLNLDPDAAVVVMVDQKFGTKESVALIHAYKSADAMNKTERKHILERAAKKSGAAPKKEAEPAAEKPAEQAEGGKKE